MTVDLVFPNDVTANLHCNYFHPYYLGIIPNLQIRVDIRFEGGKIALFNFVGPHAYHTVTVTPTNGTSKSEKAYTFQSPTAGMDYWTT